MLCTECKKEQEKRISVFLTRKKKMHSPPRKCAATYIQH